MDGSKNLKNLQQKTLGIPGVLITKEIKKSYYLRIKNSFLTLKNQNYLPGIPGIVQNINNSHTIKKQHFSGEIL